MGLAIYCAAATCDHLAVLAIQPVETVAEGNRRIYWLPLGPTAVPYCVCHLDPFGRAWFRKMGLTE